MQFFNGYGGFSKDGREYIIKLKKGEATPAPWVNVMANENFGTVVSESGGGYTWFKNSREFKLTEWSNDSVLDTPSEVITINGQNIMRDCDRRVTVGMGYSVFESKIDGIEVKATVFVPRHRATKVTILKMKAARDCAVDIRYDILPALGVSRRVTEHYIEREGDTFRNQFNPDYAGVEVRLSYGGCPRKPQNAPYRANFPRALLVVNRRRRPAQFSRLARRKLAFGNLHSGLAWTPSSKKRQVLLAKKEAEVVLELGIDEVGENVHEELAEIKAFWRRIADKCAVKTGDAANDILLGGWLAYQNISCRLWARAAFYQCGGAIGFRDQLQDSLAVLECYPEIARKQIICACEHQFIEGDVQHWFHLPRHGVRTKFSDDLLWLPYVAWEYARVTGDEGIWNEEVAFLESPLLGDDEHERYEVPRVSSEVGTVLEHCERAIKLALSRIGEHGLPLIGGGDWNDGFSNVGVEWRGESVWMAWFLVDILQKYGWAEAAESIAKAANEYGWDGEWFRRAYYDNGEIMGQKGSDECEIDAIAQAWAVISGAGEREKCEKAMDAVEEKLVDRENKLIKLLTPPFGAGNQEPGYIKSYVAGVRENGGQYTHAAAWVILAFYRMGRVELARELFSMVNPINHSGDKAGADRYRVEPYVVAADVYTAEGYEGMGGWTWYTGAAGWLQCVGAEIFANFQS